MLTFKNQYGEAPGDHRAASETSAASPFASATGLSACCRRDGLCRRLGRRCLKLRAHGINRVIAIVDGHGTRAAHCGNRIDQGEMIRRILVSDCNRTVAAARGSECEFRT